MRHSALRQTRADTERSYALFWLAPAGIRRFIVSRSVKTLSGLLTQGSLRFSPRRARPHHDWEQAVSFLCHCRDSRHPYLRTAACPAGGGTFLSGHVRTTVSRSLPLTTTYAYAIHNNGVLRVMPVVLLVYVPVDGMSNLNKDTLSLVHLEKTVLFQW